MRFIDVDWQYDKKKVNKQREALNIKNISVVTEAEGVLPEPYRTVIYSTSGDRFYCATGYDDLLELLWDEKCPIPNFKGCAVNKCKMKQE